MAAVFIAYGLKSIQCLKSRTFPDLGEYIGISCSPKLEGYESIHANLGPTLSALVKKSIVTFIYLYVDKSTVLLDFCFILAKP